MVLKAIVVGASIADVVASAEPTGPGALSGNPGLVALVRSLPGAEGGIVGVVRFVNTVWKDALYSEA